jgi:hypothetical protein
LGDHFNTLRDDAGGTLHDRLISRQLAMQLELPRKFDHCPTKRRA